MKLTFLGTGTSHGVPVINCNCKVCRSHNKKNKRYRSSVYIQTKSDKTILIDCGPEFRLQALRNKISKIDLILLTHSHADHLHGIDDIRIFSCNLSKEPDNPEGKAKFHAPPIPIYTNKTTVTDLQNRFGYFFTPCSQGGGKPKVELKEVSETFDFYDVKITPIPMMHGSLETAGWLISEKDEDGNINSIAYLTDCSSISSESLKLIKDNCFNLKHLIIDALRIKEHSTHFNFDQAMEFCNQLNAEKVWFTHLTHQTSHWQVKKYIKKNLQKYTNLQKAKSVLPAYDQLKIFS